MSLNDIPLAPSWSTRFHYYHHSNASKDLAYVNNYHSIEASVPRADFFLCELSPCLMGE